MGVRPVRVPKEEPAHDKHLHGAGHIIWFHGCHASYAGSSCAGNDHQRIRLRSCALGNRFDLVGISAVADRILAPPRNAGTADETLWICAAHDGSEGEDFWFECRTRVRG